MTPLFNPYVRCVPTREAVTAHLPVLAELDLLIVCAVAAF